MKLVKLALLPAKSAVVAGAGALAATMIIGTAATAPFIGLVYVLNNSK